MIIHEPQIKKEEGEICISSFIEIKSDNSLPDTLWFKFPEEYEEFISDGSSGFVVGLSFLAMYLGEDIEVQGKMSPKLAYGLKQFQSYFNFWYPDRYKIVNIKCDKFESERSSGSVACSFSGGIDSFYTLYSHLPENEDNLRNQITHLLYIDGFDTLQGDPTYSVAKKHYEEFANKHGIKLLTASTNIRNFLGSKMPNLVKPSVGVLILISVVLVLSRLLSRFYVASSLKYSDLYPLASNPITDHLLSTENLEVIHHGADMSRVDKTRVIAYWPETYDKLRVCWWPDGLKNCCRCAKCIRTMTALELEGVLSKYKTFPLPLESKNIRNWFVEYYDEVNVSFAKEVMDYAVFLGRKDIARNIKYAILKPKLIKLSPKRLVFRASHKLKKRYPFYYDRFIKGIKKQKK